MANLKVCAIVALFSLFSLIQTGESIRCFVCQSSLDSKCDDPFNSTLTTQSNWGATPYFVTQDCSNLRSPSSIGASMKTVCRKQVQIVHDRQRVVTRSCSWQHIDEPVGKCPQAPVASHIKVDFCETCDHDGCNSAPGLANFNIWIQLAVFLPPVFISKWMLF